MSDQGYGISYMIAGDFRIFFHVSSKRSCINTDSAGFVDAIFEVNIVSYLKPSLRVAIVLSYIGLISTQVKSVPFTIFLHDFLDEIMNYVSFLTLSYYSIIVPLKN